MISEEEIKHLAELAHLYLGPKEIKKYQKELSEILAYVSQLQKAKIEKSAKAEPEIVGDFRPDETWSEKISTPDDLLKSSPAREKDFIKTKSVFAKSKKTIKKSTKI